MGSCLDLAVDHSGLRYDRLLVITVRNHCDRTVQPSDVSFRIRGYRRGERQRREVPAQIFQPLRPGASEQMRVVVPPVFCGCDTVKVEVVEMNPAGT